MSKAHIILITGANAGIGLETVRALAKSSQKYSIILGARSEDKLNAAIESLRKEIPDTQSTFEGVQIDVTDDDSINKAFESVKGRYSHIQTLINNAGASFDYDMSAGKVSMREAWNKAWDVNTTGAYITTYTFAPLLVASAEAGLATRLLFLTSGTASVAETVPGSSMTHLTQAPNKGWPKKQAFDVTAYRSSKVGLNMMMRQWERIFREDGIKTFAISPGFLATGLGNGGEEGKDKLRDMGAGEAHIGGEFIRDVVQGERDDDAGKAIRKDKVQPW